jgi:dihydropteroate synthase
MGILNLNGDSFYAPSRYNFPVLDEGPDILDIGAVSTRPGAADVSAAEEWARLKPVLRTLDGGVAVSVDTTRAEIVERACDLLGRPVIVNDISAGEDDPDMLPAVGRLGLEYVAMHKRGTPATMQSMCEYGDVVSDLVDYFRAFAVKASEHGISDWVLDPGFGFAKTVEQNYRLLYSLEDFAVLGRPVLVGISRKSFIYRVLGKGPEDVLTATQVLHMAALERGADILRVHDVAAARETLTLYRRLNGA